MKLRKRRDLGKPHTFAKLAVNTTTSYISPIFCKKLSTPGRLRT